ncbi:MAG: cache domain-containing protein [Treponema sp.]|nr:cache domain-containing protein [Treponema sp.]
MNHSQGKAARRTYPIRFLLLALVVGPMVVASVLVGLLTWINSREAVAESSDRLFVESSKAVAARLTGLLSSATMIDRVNYEAYLSDDLDPRDVSGIEDHLLALLRANPAVSSVYIGSPEGGIVDAGREGPGGAEYLIETPNFAAGSFIKYSINSEGRKTGILASIPSFDARKRPWYTQAVARKGLVWTGIFPLFTGQDSTISAARPVYSQDGKILAVVSVDLFVSQIASYLREISSTESGISFIVNRDGLLVASPADASIFAPRIQSGPARRLSAAESVEPRIAGAAAALEKEKALGPSGKPYVMCEVGSARYFAFSAPLADPVGRDWRIVTVYPEYLILGSIDRMRDIIVMSMLFGIILLGLLSYLITGFVAVKVNDFSIFAAAVAAGDRGDSSLPPPSSIKEIEAFRGDLLGMRDKLHADFDELRAEIERRKKSEKSLEESQHAYDRLASHIPVGVYRATSTPGGNFRYDYVSERYLAICGFPPGTTLADNSAEIALMHADDRPFFLEEQARARSSATPFAWEGRILVGGRLRRIRKESTPTAQPNGNILWDGMLTDITESWLATERIRSLLAEKELLLREVHHRIKNNMGSMMSLLAIQAQSSENPSVSSALLDAESRLGSMMLLYDKLYRSESVRGMDAAAYLADIAESIATQRRPGASNGSGPVASDAEAHATSGAVGAAGAAGAAAGAAGVAAGVGSGGGAAGAAGAASGGTSASGGGIKLVTELESLVLDTSILMPLGIIANELITNAYKHAFPEGPGGKIVVRFSTGQGRARLVVEDDGKGFDGADGGKGFGRTVVAGLASQLGGELSFVSEGGTRVELGFPILG